MTKKLNKDNTLFLVDMELMLHNLIVDIMERYGCDIEQAKEVIIGLVEIQALVEIQTNEKQEEAEVNENNA